MLSSLSHREGEFTFSVFEECHVKIAVLFDPALVDLGPQGSDQPQSGGLVWKYPHHVGSSFYLLVEPLDHVGGLEMFAV